MIKMTDNELYHYGTPRHSGRYPYGSGKRPFQGDQIIAADTILENRYDQKIAKQQYTKVNNLINDLNSNYDYGCIIDGVRYDDNLSDVDWSKYRTMPIDEFKKNKIGVCWDYVNYQHDECEKNGIPNENFMLVARRSNRPDDILTHTFTVVEIGGKKYWIESSRWKDRGVHEINSYKDVINKIKMDDFKDKPYDVYKYNPDNLDKRLTDQEYFDRATENLIETSQSKNYRKIT